VLRLERAQQRRRIRQCTDAVLRPGKLRQQLVPSAGLEPAIKKFGDALGVDRMVFHHVYLG
jgi:hypothetical protein